MQWTDTKLKWDNSSYGGISVIRVSADEVRLTAQITRSINQNLIALLSLPSNQIWQPDLTVYNSAEPNIVDHFAKTNKLIYYGGTVLWVSLPARKNIILHQKHRA